MPPIPLSTESLALLQALVEETIAKGQTLDWFVRQIRDRGEPLGWHEAFQYSHVSARFRRSGRVLSACHRIVYSNKRHVQLQDGAYDYWIYRFGDDRHCPAHHQLLDGLPLEPQHPFWQLWAPPNSLLCSCGVDGARSIAGIRRMGGDPEKTLPQWWSEPAMGPDRDYVGYARPCFERIVERALEDPTE
jgi:hypothetical protein